jgi:peptidoglycan-N-acetylmuramic acid deacetylase
MSIPIPKALRCVWLLLAMTLPTLTAARAATPLEATSSTAAAKPAAKKKATTASKSAGKTHAATSATLHPKEWWYHPHKDHSPSGAPEDIAFQKYHGYFLGDTKGKVVYLTFDEGSEAGFTKKILDTLKDNNIHATFFVTRFYMKEAPDLVKRMLAEGHTVGNHSATHPDLSRRSDSQVKDEILLPAQYFKQLTGKDMPQLFRPPMGECDERILKLTDSLGWRSIFWSMAYVDYITNKQKGSKFAVNYVMKYHHPGAIILLHPFASNAQALGEIIKDLKAQGYQFGNLMDMKG